MLHLVGFLYEKRFQITHMNFLSKPWDYSVL